MSYEPREQRLSKHIVSFLVVLAVLGLGIGLGTIISDRVVATGPGDSQLKIQGGGQSLAPSGLLALSQAFEEVARRVGPAVVNINTAEVVSLTTRPGQGRRGQVPDLFDQLNPEGVPMQRTLTSLGSGIIVDPKGYILTNNHVVEGASKIKVTVKGGKEYNARLIGGDQFYSDIAVLKIEGDKDFPYARIGDDKAMKVGDWVIAMGSPFGLEHTVTAGIISAIGRVFESYETTEQQAMLWNDYLQTDAAINPGNSGGPLVNMSGEVVGINSFINTSTRANAGVGFAVPSHAFVDVYNQILEKGRVSRGYLGVLMNTQFPFTPAMADYFGVKQGSGVLITGLDTEKKGPAELAGIKAEDVIIEYDGKTVTNVPDLRHAAANTPPGRTVKVKAVRFGTVMDFSVTVAERTLESDQAKNQPISFDEKKETRPEIGMNIDNIPARLARELPSTGGAMVLNVTPGSLAEEAGLVGQRDAAPYFDVIVAANGKKIQVSQDFLEVVKETKSGRSVVIKLIRVDKRNMSSVSTAYTSLIIP
jgi:serine protease Do